MDNIILEQKWNNINYNGKSIFEFIRIDSVCIPELNIGFNSKLNRCLILELPKECKVDYQSTIKQNLTLDIFKDTNYIVIQLTDNNFYDLFNDLIISLYHKIKQISNVNEYSKELVQTFYKWSEFFDDRKSDLLSEEAIKGLFGELLVLKILIMERDRIEINFILNSWKGPYDKATDFELENKDLEVKTKSPTGVDVKISSEFQLEVSQGKGLELFVVSLLSDFTVGIHIKDLILEIKKIVQEYSGDSSILWKALSQKNITAKNVSEYDRYRFKPINWISFNCADENFPKLSRSNIPVEISGLKYTLRTNLLSSFIIEQNDF